MAASFHRFHYTQSKLLLAIDNPGWDVTDGNRLREPCPKALMLAMIAGGMTPSAHLKSVNRLIAYRCLLIGRRKPGGRIRWSLDLPASTSSM